MLYLFKVEKTEVKDDYLGLKVQAETVVKKYRRPAAAPTIGDVAEIIHEDENNNSEANE